jgi:hypothetical protein
LRGALLFLKKFLIAAEADHQVRIASRQDDIRLMIWNPFATREQGAALK